jgi:WD40 repeat protein
VTGSNDGMVRLWDIEAGESRVLEGHRGHVTAVEFALGGQALISAGQDGTVRRWMDELPTDGATLRAFLEATTPETIESLGVHPRAP